MIDYYSGTDWVTPHSTLLTNGNGSRFLYKEPAMHDILVALAFVAMVACPAIVASMPRSEMKDDA